MTEMIVVQCDYGDGECLETWEGFEIHIRRWQRDSEMCSKGWRIDEEGRHFCPKHKKEKEDG